MHGNAKIREDGRLANDFLGGAVLDILDIGQLQETKQLDLVDAQALEVLLPKAFRERRRHKHEDFEEDVAVKKESKKDEVKYVLKGGKVHVKEAEVVQSCGRVTFKVVRARKKQSFLNSKNQNDDDDEDHHAMMSDPLNDQYADIRASLQVLAWLHCLRCIIAHHG